MPSLEAREIKIKARQRATRKELGGRESGCLSTFFLFFFVFFPTFFVFFPSFETFNPDLSLRVFLNFAKLSFFF